MELQDLIFGMKELGNGWANWVTEVYPKMFNKETNHAIFFNFRTSNLIQIQKLIISDI
ncbi:MAG: hypothetical protein LBG80_12290 [Bacteroidales bacterium]|nr:hypothetical protein [Bacteroidales bacterium]